MMSSIGMKENSLPKILRISTKASLISMVPTMRDMAADADFS